MTESKRTTLNVQIDGTAINATDIVSFSYQPQFAFTNAGGMEVVKLALQINLDLSFTSTTDQIKPFSISRRCLKIFFQISNT
jgi:hypothetical protein